MLWILMLLLGAGSQAALAQSAAIPYAAAEYEHSTNLFFLPGSGPIPQGKSGPTFADNTLRWLAGLDADYTWDRQKFFARGEARRFQYDNFGYLDHSEVLAEGGLNWKIGRLLDGVLDYRHERRMVPFTDLIDSTQLFIETENVASGSANILVTPDWRLESSLRGRTLDSPRAGALDLSLREDSIHEALRYLGLADWTAGFELDYLSGRFNNVPLAETPRYHQTTAELAANYTVSNLTSLKGTLGYTRRSDLVGDNVSGITGSLTYQRSLTGKTSVTVNLKRAVESYVTTAGSEIDTSAAFAVLWRVTYKTSVNAGYTWTENKFPQLLIINGGVQEDRVDHLQFANLELDYQALRWLSVRAYGRYQTRHSNLENYAFDAKIYGIEFEARLPNRH